MTIISSRYLFEASTPGKIKPGRRFEDALFIDGRKQILCRSCLHGITDNKQKISRQGRFIHRRTNPSGVTFEFGCYEKAPGCAALGTATTEHTWFQGYGWKLATCTGCGEHLGWLFKGDASFYGLIQARLVPAEE